MDDEIRKMTGALRLTHLDGFSEILAKSVLWGQWPVSPYIHYPYIDKDIIDHVGTNREGAAFYRSIINQYPWNGKLGK